MPAVEVEVRDWLEADASVSSAFRTIELYQVQVLKPPVLVINLIGDTNEKRFLSSYSGSALLQFDIYDRSEAGAALRQTLKDALRRMIGTIGGLRHVWTVVTNERVIQPAAEGFRWTVDATVNWEE